MHFGIEIGETAGRESAHLAFVKVISHSDFEGSGDDRDVFPLRMPMGRDAISVRHLQTNGIIATRCTGIALKHSQLRARPHERRRWTERNRIGREGMFFRSGGLSTSREVKTRSAQESQQRNRKEPASFHRSASIVRCTAERIFFPY